MRLQLLDGISRLYDLAEAGKPVTFDDRSLVRRNQIRSAWRAAHVGLQHAIHIPGPVHHSTALTAMGIEAPPPPRVTI